MFIVGRQQDRHQLVLSTLPYVHVTQQLAEEEAQRLSRTVTGPYSFIVFKAVSVTQLPTLLPVTTPICY